WRGMLVTGEWTGWGRGRTLLGLWAGPRQKEMSRWMTGWPVCCWRPGRRAAREAPDARRDPPARRGPGPPGRAVRPGHGGAARVGELGAAGRHGGHHRRRRRPPLAPRPLHPADGAPRGEARARRRQAAPDLVVPPPPPPAPPPPPLP